MFKLHLPGIDTKSAYYDSTNQLKFDPPVYEQRYAITIRFLEHEFWQGKIKKIVDFGCAEMKLLPLLKRIEGVEEIVEVDIDKDLLKTYSQRADPLFCDYLKQREKPLKIDIFKGSISTPDICLKNTDAVICIEIIEHLYPDVLEEIPFNIFGYIKPKIAIFTTPNVEFNVLFRLEQPNGFRHWDHKFEWTRAQFKNWCLNICKRFPNYLVSIHGVSVAPPEQKKLGSVSQMAVFVRKDMLNENDIITISNDEDDNQGVNEYELIYNVNYPFTPDHRTNDEKILDEIIYHINRCKGIDCFIKYDKEIFEIPLEYIFNYVMPLIKTKDELKNLLLSNNYDIVNDNIIIKMEPEDIEEFDDICNSFRYDDEWNCDDDELNKNNTDEVQNVVETSSECWD